MLAVVDAVAPLPASPRRAPFRRRPRRPNRPLVHRRLIRTDAGDLLGREPARRSTGEDHRQDGEDTGRDAGDDSTQETNDDQEDHGSSFPWSTTDVLSPRRPSRYAGPGRSTDRPGSGRRPAPVEPGNRNRISWELPIRLRSASMRCTNRSSWMVTARRAGATRGGAPSHGHARFEQGGRFGPE